MNPPRRWPLDPRRSKAPCRKPGRFAIGVSSRPKIKNPGTAIAVPDVKTQPLVAPHESSTQDFHYQKSPHGQALNHPE